MCINVRCRYNWAENMRAWRLDMHLPYPGAAGALVHSGALVGGATVYMISVSRIQGSGRRIAPCVKAALPRLPRHAPMCR